MERIEPEHVVGALALDHRTGFTHPRLECPHAHIGDRVPAQRQPVPLDQLGRLRHLEMQPLRRAVQPTAVGLRGRQAIQRVGARVDGIEMPTLRNDGDRDVTHVESIAFRGFDAEQMVAEARAYRLAELPRRQAAQARQKLGIKPGLVALHPAQIAAPRATHRVRRLLLGRVLELHRTSRDLVPQAPRFRERRRRVGGVGHARLRHEAEPGRGWALEVVFVGRVVALDLVIRHRGERVRNLVGADVEHGDRHGLVLITPDAPQPGVGDIDVGGEVLLELALREILAVQLLDLGAELLAGATEIALPLGDVEPAVRLERGILHDLPQDLRRWGTARHLPDFIVRHLDPEPAILALEQDFLDELVGDLILELLFVFAGQPRAGLTAGLLDGRLERRLELGARTTWPLTLRTTSRPPPRISVTWP